MTAEQATELITRANEIQALLQFGLGILVVIAVSKLFSYFFN